MFKLVNLVKNIFILIVFNCFFINRTYSQDYSIRFDGINDYAYILDHSNLDLTSNYTLEAWIFPETFSWLSGIISKYHTNASNGYMLRLNQNPPYTGLAFDEMETNNGILHSNEWFHIAAVKNSNSRKLYVNGIEINLSGNPLSVSSNSDPVRIASDYAGRYFHGRIDEVRIWDESRSIDEINIFMDSSLTGNETGLVAYFNFNEGNGDTLFDVTQNNHNATLVGDPQWVDGFTVFGILGDLNFDEILNIYDAVQLVIILLDNSYGNDQQIIASDTNEDGIIDIDDIVLLIQWILNVEYFHRNPINHFELFKKNKSITINSDGDLAAFSIELKNDATLENEFNMPNGWSYKQEKNKLIAFSINGSSFPLNYNINFKYTPFLEKVTISDWNGKKEIIKKLIPTNYFTIKAYPNPFNGECILFYTQPNDGNLLIELYDIRGHLIKTYDQGYLYRGDYDFRWNPKTLGSGIYFFRIISNNNINNKKIIYLK